MSAALQLELPFLGDEPARSAAAGVVVEVVLDGDRPRVRPVDRAGWVRFPKRLRDVGARYRVERLTPIRGGAWAATGRIRRVRVKKR